ncbi:heavy-metal-associated domain-containing protein [Desulfamplus magnetovallimortis]|uniref:heavy-metal-associated domain-containing protein n=1 Tax=Desulfamplus magnetovallimortis TaxID=1246637 RepID=UPI001119CADB|nr:heavy metal-associated domain-containing protein [Desulfamplus magnetovallimortis]
MILNTIKKQSIILPVTGMHCVNCAANIEKNVGKLTGITNINVNFPAEQINLTFSPEEIELSDIVKRIEELGFRIPCEKEIFPITGMSCANCASGVERTFNKKFRV